VSTTPERTLAADAVPVVAFCSGALTGRRLDLSPNLENDERLRYHVAVNDL
jgi:hypothetical protein